MTVTKLRGTLQEYFEHMTGRTIDGVGVFDGELILMLDNKDEVCIFLGDHGDLCIQINPPAELDD